MPQISFKNPRIFAFIEKISVDAQTECWLWTGSISPQGYGKFRSEKSIVLAHRWSYKLFVGPIPEDLSLDHLCRVRRCVNPKHLEAVTPLLNSQRGNKNQNAGKTHCPKGHPYDSKQGNTEWRRCIQCHNEYRRHWRAKKKLENALEETTESD